MVIDSSIFIEHLRSKDQTKTTFANLPRNQLYFVSSVTKFEVLSGATDAKKWSDAEALFVNMTVLSFDDDVSQFASKIKLNLQKRGLNIEYRDLFIGATALFHQMPIKTLNVKDFSKIPGLQLA